MLRRQKALLALLAECQPLTSTALVKCAFLLRQETDYASDPAFYDFVPYKYGPFSFSLYRELESLQRNGLVSDKNGCFFLATDHCHRSLEKTAELSQAERSSVAHIAQKYGKMQRKALLRDVYRRYPHYAQKSELTELQDKRVPEALTAIPAAYTAGYEQKSVDAFFDGLIRSGIHVVIDVRANPVSRKYGFAGSSFAGIAHKLGFQYLHLPSLGIPSKARASLTNRASYARLLSEYESRLPQHGPEIKSLGEQMAGAPSVLVCLEKDVSCCHRSRLATAVAKQSGLTVRHL